MGTDQVISELTGKIEFLLNRQVQMEQKSQELTMRVQRLESYEEDNKNLRQENKELKDKILELEARLNSNSNNSSKPPSSDGYRKKPALPKERKGKQGGQEGHKGRTLEQVENPDEIIYCDPDHCGCGHTFIEDELVLSETRQVFNT